MKNKLSIKDIFTNPIEETPIPETNNVVSETENRMVELLKSWEQTGEIIKDNTKVVNEEKLKKETDRLKAVARIDEFGKANQFSANVPSVMGYGQTVNTFIDNINPVNAQVNNKLNNPNSNKLYNPNYTYLDNKEAIRVAISRALNSGAPINDIGFYEEVNHFLNELGFLAKSPLDIKTTILNMISKTN